MYWEFIGKSEVTNISNNQFKRVMITIGIVCLLFSLATGVIIGNKSAWFFAIPLIYLLSLRKEISKKKYLLTIPMSITINDKKIEIIFSNTIRNKSGIFSEKYVFDVDDIKKCNYLKKHRELQIITNSQYYKISELSHEIGKTRTRNISFKLASEVEIPFLKELNEKTTIDFFD